LIANCLAIYLKQQQIACLVMGFFSALASCTIASLS
jgi:hypothetical protein